TPEYWVRTGQLTNMTNPHTFGTPCTNFGSNGAELEFDHCITTMAGSSLKRLDVVIVDSEGNDVDTIYTHIYTNINLIQARVPLTLAGSYTIQWRWIGAGGRGRGLLDNITVPGTNMSDPTNGCSCNTEAFPVEWTHVEAWQENNAIQFSWGTASELNTDYFEVQQSIDGEHYESLGQVQAAGYSARFRSYDFEASAPLVNVPYLYRVKQVDLDGSYSYSRVMELSTEIPQQLDVTFYPNPARDRVSIDIKGHAGELVQIHIIDVQGRLVETRSVVGGGTQEIDMAHLPSGMYFIETRDAFDKVMEPIILER
ncbi:MAG: T9SS type A sorting domain-containing protein, partial [Bacteroidota bacterium]